MSPVSVFAVEDTSVQVCWHDLPAGTTISAGDSTVEVGGGGPGAATLDGLPPATTVDVLVRRPGAGAPRAAATARTLAPPPGELLGRFATVNDLHLGERHFGLSGLIRERRPAGGDPYPLRCARAALREAVAWGATAVVAKGDLTYSGRPQQWSDVADLLAGTGVPVAAIPGNHDVGAKAVDGRAAFAARGLVLTDEPAHVDLPGIRVVLVDTTIPTHHGGTVAKRAREQVADLLAGAPGSAFLATHHYAQRFRVPMAYPAGIPGPDARLLLDAVVRANPATLVSAGHTHRNRRRRWGPLVLTEVAATMHYPGVWAGYAVHEGGIRQVVRRVAAPDAIAWTERTRRALLGGWGVVSPGLLSHRCFSHPWPDRR
ncbi:MAG TPA: metallophosphoesterase [Acidimicrobiales bacterium]|nr:metallophosphoesterase [Acidimicrobiales bacterium]